METRLGARAALAAALAILLGATCTPRPLAPTPGLAAWQEPAAFEVRDGVIDLAGGNLLLLRTDLTIDTRLGPQAVTHAWSSATDRWTWSFEMTYANGLFRDDTGALHAPGTAWGPIPGTRWRAVDAATIESRGGLRFSFAPDGRLARIAWRQASYPRLELQRPGDGSLHVAQCTAAAACADVYVVRYAGADVTGIVDRAGREFEYGYAGGRLAWVRTAFDRDEGLPAQRYDYELGADGRPAAIVVTSPEQERVRYELDGEGRAIAWTALGEESPRWTFRYDADPFRTLVTDPLGRETELRFDVLRQLVEVDRRALGERMTLAWSGRRVTRVVGPDGLAATARYDAADELVESTLPSGRRFELEYAPGSVHLADPWTALPSRVRDARTLLVERTFDAQGRLASETNGAGERTAFHYGALETLASVDLPNGLVVRFAEYGEHGKPVEVRIPAADPADPDYVERRELDALGDLTLGTDPGSESGTQFPGVVARRFDAARRVSGLVMSESSHEAPQDLVLVHRSDGQLRAIQRPYGATTEFDYDALGRLRARRERVDGAWVTTRFAWTPLGELARSERPNGMTQELAYDAAGRVVRRTNRRGADVESDARYTYEAGRLVRRDDSTSGATRIAYDEQGRVDAITWPAGEQTWLGRDARDRPTTSLLVGADGQPLRQLGLRYDAAGRETRLLDGAAVVYEQVYAAGRLAEIRHGNGVVRTLSYDEFGRPSGAVSRDGAGRVLETETVVRQGRTFAGPDPNGPFRETHARYEATAASGPVAFAERAVGFHFVDGSRWIAGLAADSGTVDWCNGPECGDPANSSWFVHSGLMDLESELLPSRGGDVRRERVFVKNPERNRLHEVRLRTTTPPPDSCPTCPPSEVEEVEHRYTWDEAGFATSRDGVPITWDATGHPTTFGDALFVYDAEGRLRGSMLAGVVRLRRFGGLVEADASGRPLHLDLGPVDIDLAAGGRTYRHFDWRGNVRSLWSDAGELRSVREYGAYGLDRLYGEAGDPRGFAQGLDAGELVVLGDRLYDPAARQFLSPDPIYGIFHQYVYGAGDPANYWDWTGRAVEDTAGFKIAGALAEGVGFSGGFLVGLAFGARTGNAMVALTLAGAFAVKGAEASRGWVEILYAGLHRWFTTPPPNTSALGGDAPLGPLVPSPLAGPPQPQVLCPGECFVSWNGKSGRSGPPGGFGNDSGFGGGSFFSFSAPACGLLGIEPLVLLAFAARRRRRALHGRRNPWQRPE